MQVIHRRDELRAGETLKKRAFTNDKIGFIWDSVVEAILGENKVETVRIRNVKTDEMKDVPTDGVFIFIGHYPNSDLFQGQLEMDDRGYIITNSHMMTSVPGVFAAGEIQDPVYRQIGTSVGQGVAAAMQTEKWLSERE